MFDTLNSAMNFLLPEYSGSYMLGVVIDNVDPDNLGRIKVNVPGLYDLDVGEIPWCGPDKHAQFGHGATWGTYGSPAIGSDVLILLQNGDPHYPVYRSTQCHANSEFPSGASWGWVDPFGNVFKCLADKTVQFRAIAGTEITVSPSGDITIHTVANATVNTDGNTAINTQGNTSIVSQGDTLIKTDGAMTLESGGNMVLRAAHIDFQES